LKESTDDQWDMGQIAHTLTNRRWKEPVVAYAESHDQAIVGDKTLSMWLFNEQIYSNMSIDSHETIEINRGMALHKMIRLLTLALGGSLSKFAVKKYS
jgi:1,4-alpha-glucan branching enzyme